MADLGSLVVKLSAETSEFRADLGRTARLLDRHANDMKTSLQQVATVAKTAFAVAVGAASVGALRDFIDRTIEATAALQQLSEQTGASTTALSGLAPVAPISGTAIETIGTNLSKLSKALSGLAENQNLNIRLTAQQIEEADKASKAMARMRAESSFVSQTLVTSAIPAFSVLAEELKKILLGTDNAVAGISRLRDDGTLAKWAEASAYAIAVLVDSLRAIFQGIKAIVGSFQAVWADIELAGGFIARGALPGLVMESNRKALREALDKRNQIVEEANRNYVDLWNMPLLADAVTQRFEEMRCNAQAGASPQGDKPQRPTLQYNTASDANRAEALAGIERDVKRLQDELDVESALLKDLQRIIDLYEGQGFRTFQQGSAARIAAQEDFTERLRANMAEEEAILKRGLATVAKTTQEKARLT